MTNPTNRIVLKGFAEMAPRYIDMTPTFEEATAMCLAVIEASHNEGAKAEAREELFRYARALDDLKRSSTK